MTHSLQARPLYADLCTVPERATRCAGATRRIDNKEQCLDYFEMLMARSISARNSWRSPRTSLPTADAASERAEGRRSFVDPGAPRKVSAYCAPATPKRVLSVACASGTGRSTTTLDERRLCSDVGGLYRIFPVTR